MPLRDILVHIDNAKPCQARLELAVNLAQAHQAHLTGLSIPVRREIPTYIMAQIPSDALESLDEKDSLVSAELETAFREKAEKSGLSFEWRLVKGDPVETLSLHARYSDLTVVGQYDGDAAADDLPGDMPDRLILSAGRPVLVVPYAGRYPRVGERVMVAWDGSRSATRAVNDALPLLGEAKKVSVLAIDPQATPGRHGDIPGADICLHLARHGIKAEAQHTPANDLEVGDMLLSRSADAGADLIVMSAYGHARWRELVLGGVTRHMLEHMTAPVLMSH